MATLQDRVRSLESQLRTAESNITTLTRHLSAIDARISSAASGEAQTRIDPGSLHEFSAPHRAHRQGRAPELGQPLLARLRDDALMNTGAGLSTPFTGSANVLADPTFETNYYDDTTYFYSAIVLTTAYKALGPNWEAKRSSTGDVPGNIYMAGSPYDRIRPDSNLGANSSADVQQIIEWISNTTAGTTETYLRPKATYAPLPIGEPGFLIGSIRVTVAGDSPYFVDDSLTSWTAWMEIVDASDTVLATGDPVDLIQIALELSKPVIHASLAAPDTSGATSYRLRVVTQAVIGVATATVGCAMYFTEPMLMLNEEDSPPSFTPAIGAWAPYFLNSVNVRKEMALSGVIWHTIGADHDDWEPTGWQDCSMLAVDFSGTGKTVTGFAAPTTGVQGTVKVIYNFDLTHDLKLAHNSGSSSSLNTIYCPGNADLTIRSHGGVVLMWFGDASGTSARRWRVISMV